MDRGRRLVTTRKGVAGATSAVLVLLAATAAMAISVALPPGGSVVVPSTTAATEPDLNGTVIHDALVPFTIRTAAGQVLCGGQLQDRVVRSTRTRRLHFYYRVRNTSGSGAVNGIATSAFSGLPIDVAFRIDGLGTVPPRHATRSPAPGAVVTFEVTDPPISCAQHQESRFILIKTPATTFKPGGTTQLVATTGAKVSVPTVMP